MAVGEGERVKALNEGQRYLGLGEGGNKASALPEFSVPGPNQQSSH